MRPCFSSILAAFLALLLAACGDAPTLDGDATENASEVAELDEVPVMGPELRVLAFGDSLFAGYGVDKSDSYPAKLESALRAQGINARVTNAGVSGDTSAAGRQRLAFTLDAQAEKPDLFILELGGNDLLRGIAPEQTRENFDAILRELDSRDIPVLIMGMRSPPNYGPDYQRQFDGLYGDMAREFDAELIPFWLESIYQDQSLFQDDRIHPTEEGIEELVAATSTAVAEALD